MSGQEDLLKQAIKLRQQALKEGASVTSVAVTPKKALEEVLSTPTPVVKQVDTKTVVKPVPEKAAFTPPSQPVRQKEVRKTVGKKVSTSIKPKRLVVSTLTPAMRSFSPIIRKTMLEHFKSVSMGSDRAIIRNPLSDNISSTNIESFVRGKLEEVGVVIDRVDPIVKSELNPDTSYRVFFTK